MPSLFRNESYDAKRNAQRNLCGRTHYVDDDTLRFHKSRVMSATHHDDGLLFSIVTSDALDFENTKRGFRYVVFDLFGHVLSRTDLESAYRTSEQARKALYAYLDTIDAHAVTLAGIDREREANEREFRYVLETLERMRKAAA